MSRIEVPIGRGNRTRLQLQSDGEVVTAGAVTRAVFRFGEHCIDTQDSPLIELTDSATVVEMRLGLIEGLAKGRHKGWLTVYDNPHPEGVAWYETRVDIVDWPVCD